MKIFDVVELKNGDKALISYSEGTVSQIVTISLGE